MFDNPKKELEWLEEQLLAAETTNTEDDFDSLYEDIYDEFGDESPDALDDELRTMLDDIDVPIRNYSNHYGQADREFSRRAAGFDAEEEDYYMDTERYVAPPKKKGIRGLLIVACLEAVAIIALAAWWLGRLL